MIARQRAEAAEHSAREERILRQAEVAQARSKAWTKSVWVMAFAFALSVLLSVFATRACVPTNSEATFARSAEADAQTSRAQAVMSETRALAANALSESLLGFYTDAVKLALVAWPRSAADQRPMVQTIKALGRGLTGPLVGALLNHDARVNRAAFSPDGSRVVTASADKTARVSNRRPANK